MARTVAWEHRAHELRNRVRNSSIETWTRKDIMDLFEVRSTAAKHILRAVGKVHRLGTTYLVERQDLLALLEKTLQRQSVTAEFRRNLLRFQPPRRHPIHLTLDEQHRTVSADDLPATITLEPGHLSIRGQDSTDVLAGLKLLVAALEGDFEGVVSYLDQPEERDETGPAEMDALLEGLLRLRQNRVPPPKVSALAITAAPKPSSSSVAAKL